MARTVVEKAIGEHLNGSPIDDSAEGKNPHAVALGKLGGQKGGMVRAQRLTARQRRNIALKAAKARWSKGK